MAKAPAFQFYPKDFLTDLSCIRLSDEEAGIYVRMMSMYWIENRTLPSDLRVLAEILPHTTHARLKKAWVRLSQCWTIDGEQLRHGKLDSVAEAQARFRENASASGKIGASRRYARVPHENTGEESRVPHETANEKPRVSLADKPRVGLATETWGSGSSSSASSSAETNSALDSLDINSRAREFALEFYADAVAAGVLQQVLDPGLWASKCSGDAQELVLLHGDQVCRDRGRAFVRAIVAKKIRRAPTIRDLRACFDWREVAVQTAGAETTVERYLATLDEPIELDEVPDAAAG